MIRPYRTYTPEFRDEAVNLLRTTDRNLREVSESLGISVFSLRAWYKKSEMAKRSKKNKPPPRPSVLGEETEAQKVARLERENAALRKEVDTLRMDREILKKAAAFFAKENE
jgi:transposase-like protein